MAHLLNEIIVVHVSERQSAFRPVHGSDGRRLLHSERLLRINANVESLHQFCEEHLGLDLREVLADAVAGTDGERVVGVAGDLVFRLGVEALGAERQRIAVELRGPTRAVGAQLQQQGKFFRYLSGTGERCGNFLFWRIDALKMILPP